MVDRHTFDEVFELALPGADVEPGSIHGKDNDSALTGSTPGECAFTRSATHALGLPVEPDGQVSSKPSAPLPPIAH